MDGNATMLRPQPSLRPASADKGNPTLFKGSLLRTSQLVAEITISKVLSFANVTGRLGFGGIYEWKTISSAAKSGY